MKEHTLTKTTVLTVQVQFGDCDPAGIVFFPNFARWMDAASHHYFRECGVPSWSQIDEPAGFVGAPLVETRIHFFKPATYPDVLQVHTDVEIWRAKVFIQRHRVVRGATLVCEGHETRAFCTRDAKGHVKAVPVPEMIRALCN